MLIEQYHPEDIKAQIRKRYGSLRAFEKANDLAKQSTSEVFRGRATQRTEKAIRRVMREAGLEAKRATVSMNMGNSSTDQDVNRKNGEEA